MRRFHSYGPVDPEMHFCVPRNELIGRCVEQLVGNPDRGGHYFTVWAPRQAGKTWLVRQAIAAIQARYGDKFAAAFTVISGSLIKKDAPAEDFLKLVPDLFYLGFGIEIDKPTDFATFAHLFERKRGVLDRPVILLMDEFDSLPPHVIDRLVRLFREIYLRREDYFLHGLALIGVRAVLGVDSTQGSPFNVQRSLHVPNLTLDEVQEMYGQYQEESGQGVEPAVVDTLYEQTRGQPGLVSWFGELLTEKYNPGKEQPISLATWKEVYAAACAIEPNNTVLNLLAKATRKYKKYVLQLFARADIPFSLRQRWCNYLYLNGIIDSQKTTDSRGEIVHVCRFSSPFVQLQLYTGLSSQILSSPAIELPLEPLDVLADVFTPSGLNLPALLMRYRAYLARLRAKGETPWLHQPKRKDLRPYEAPGHFHLYAWLLLAVGKRCGVTPEFPTGNGKVDLVVHWQDHKGVIEVKSFVDPYGLKLAAKQAAGYARQLGLSKATLAVFVPIDDENVITKLSGEQQLDEVTVATVAISWG